MPAALAARSDEKSTKSKPNRAELAFFTYRSLIKLLPLSLPMTRFRNGKLVNCAALASVLKCDWRRERRKSVKRSELSCWLRET